MNCSCRTISLKIFVQSLAELRLSNSARQIQPRCSRVASFQSQFAFSRPYSATAALRFPQQISQESQEPTSQSLETYQNSESDQIKTSDDATVEEPDVPVLELPAEILDQAKSKGAILDLSLESIDALIPPSKKPKKKAQSARDKDGEGKSDAPLKSKSDPPASIEAKTPVETKRLKRLKIMKEEAQAPNTPFTPRKELWQIQKEALKEKFPEGWAPRKRLSPDALDGIRALHAQFPEEYTTPVLARKFKVSPEAIRRILRTKWTPDADEEAERQERWFKRGMNIWTKMAALGTKPPVKWRREGIVRDPYWNRRRGPRTQPPRRPRSVE
ncbi:hypothetical protein F4811DRAFT_563110 [Daldinia bambusicola]|nr:hypothetical protein F4811DRAFT_563110 [Daldinia bambusicola]